MLDIFIQIFSDFFMLRCYFLIFLFLFPPPPILREPEDPEHKIKIIWPYPWEGHLSGKIMVKWLQKAHFRRNLSEKLGLI